MTIKTDRLILKEITPEDLIDLHQLKCTPELSTYNTFAVPKEFADTELTFAPFFKDQEAETRTKYFWTIRLKQGGTFLGDCGMNIKATRYKSAEIHYGLLPTHWGKGYALEAAKGLLNFGFNSLNLHRIEAGVAIENKPSIKLLERLGMKKEGQHRQILPLPSGWSDNYSFAILKSDND